MTTVFVELMPSRLEPGRLYVSMEHRVTKHLCASGCGQPVVLPLHPGQWRITYDGKHVSLHPSVGNAGLPCRSHYWIHEDHVVWARDIGAADARAGRVRDQAAVSVAGAAGLTWWQRLMRNFRPRS